MGLREKLKWLDPFTYVDLLLDRVNPKHNPWIDWPVYLVSALFFAWIAFIFFGILFGAKVPFWIVLSPSMEPVMYRGDVVLLAGTSASNINAQTAKIDFPIAGKAVWDFASIAYGLGDNNRPEAKKIFFSEQQSFELNKSGDIIIYYSAFRQRPIIHRVALKIIAPDGIFFLTKGDSIYNPTIDQDCGRIVNGNPERNCITLYPAQEKEIWGRMFFKIPLLGYGKLLIFDDLPNLPKILSGNCNESNDCYFP